MITYQAQGVAMPKIKRREISRWINIVAQSYGKKIGEIAYLFCNDEKIIEVNKEYLNHDYYTDIITFDYSHDDSISGDLVISLDTVKSNSKELGVCYEEELRRVIVHGILHLCGIKDKTNEQRVEMEHAENRAIEILNQLNFK